MHIFRGRGREQDVDSHSMDGWHNDDANQLIIACEECKDLMEPGGT